MSVKYVYTFSSRKVMPIYLLHSIRSLQTYVDPANVIVFATPPVDPSHVETLETLGVDVRQRQHVSDAFAAFDAPSHYGDKTLLTTVDAETVVFLDCDTLVFDDPSQLITGTSFRARNETPPNNKKWRQMFAERGEPVLDWMPNAGVMVFDNGFHIKIADDWVSHLQSDLPHVFGYAYHKEQYALALAVSGHDVEQMTSSEHVFEWNDEYAPNGIVYHIGSVLQDKARVGLINEGKILMNRYKKKLSNWHRQ